MNVFHSNEDISDIDYSFGTLSLSSVGLSPTLSPTPQGTTTEEAVTSTTAEDAVTFTTTEETATTTTTEEIVTEEPLSCSFPDHYCNPTAPDLIRKVEDIPVNSAKECEDLCKR